MHNQIFKHKREPVFESGYDLNQLKSNSPSPLTTAMNSRGFQTARNFSSMSNLTKEENFKSRSIYNNPEKDLKNNIEKLKTSMIVSKNTSLPQDVLISSNPEMKYFLKSMIDTKKSNTTLTKSILLEKENIINNNKLIMQLEKELDYYRNLNLQIQGDLLMVSTRKQKIYVSEKEAQEYCRDLKKKFSIVVETIEKYEKIINDVEKRKEKLIIDSDIKLEQLSDEKMTLLEDQEALNVKINYQEELVMDLDKKLAACVQQKQNQKKYFDNKNDEDSQEIYNLQLKYYELSEKMKEYSNEEAREEYDEMMTRRAVQDLDKERVELNIKCADVVVLNDNLNDELNEYNKRIAETLKRIEEAKLQEKKNKKKYGRK